LAIEYATPQPERFSPRWDCAFHQLISSL
jgi:hypothetical protein